MDTHHRIATTAAVIVALAGAAAPTAIARPAEDPATPINHAPASVYGRPDKSMIPLSTSTGGDFVAPVAPQAVVRIQMPQSGFDPGDAGIGAAGGLALALLGVGGGLVISLQRPRRTRTTTSLPN